MRARLESVPFNEDVRTELLQLARGTFDVNIFKYSADPSLAQNVDVFAEREYRAEHALTIVDCIAAANHSSDFAFQDDLSNVFQRLKWVSPSWLLSD